MRQRLLRWSAGVFALLLIPLLVLSCATPRAATPQRAAVSEDGEEEIPPALARKMAAMAKFSPGGAASLEDNPSGFAEQDWLEHNIIDFPTNPGWEAARELEGEIIKRLAEIRDNVPYSSHTPEGEQ